MRVMQAVAMAMAMMVGLAGPAAAKGPKLKPPPKMSKAVVYTSVTIPQLQALLEPLVDEVSPADGEGASERLYFSVGRINGSVTLQRAEDGVASAYWLTAAFDFPDPVPMSTANDWNRGHLYTRAYIDADDDIVIESDLDLTGGVTEERIVDHLRAWPGLVAEFTRTIGFSPGR